MTCVFAFYRRFLFFYLLLFTDDRTVFINLRDVERGIIMFCRITQLLFFNSIRMFKTFSTNFLSGQSSVFFYLFISIPLFFFWHYVMVTRTRSFRGLSRRRRRRRLVVASRTLCLTLHTHIIVAVESTKSKCPWKILFYYSTFYAVGPRKRCVFTASRRRWRIMTI